MSSFLADWKRPHRSLYGVHPYDLWASRLYGLSNIIEKKISKDADKWRKK